MEQGELLVDPVAILFQGVALGVSLCCTLGPQSVFVLRQGLHGKAALEVATICSLADLALIVAGAVGFGALLSAFPSVAKSAGWGSALFIFGYGLKLLADAALAGAGPARSDTGRTRTCAVATAVALSVLNPQVYLEMVGVVGSVALRFPETDRANRAIFAFGVMLVSPLWFFGLAVGGRRLAARMDSRRVAQAIDLTTAAVMLGLGAALGLAEFELQ
jgi:L-lysine exporter family protein LysE/ArgO